MNKEDIIEILKELQICIFYAGVRADGNINGEDLVNALGLRCKELSAREGEKVRCLVEM